MAFGQANAPPRRYENLAIGPYVSRSCIPPVSRNRQGCNAGARGGNCAFSSRRHLAAALPDVDLVEFIGGSAYVDGITQEPFVPDDEGYLTIAATPDGVARNRDKLKQFTADPSSLFSG
jgi:hypothetical protein